MERITNSIMKRRNRGFTMVEVLIVAPVLLLLITFMGSILIGMYGNVVVESHKVLLRAEAQKLAAQLKSDLQGTAAFSSAPDALVADKNAPEDGWNYNTEPATIVARSLVYARSGGAPDSKLVYRQPNCTDPAVLNHIYFIQENEADDYYSLFRRTLAPTDDKLCGQVQIPSTCPSGFNTPGCPDDETLNRRIEDFTVTYFDDDGKELKVYDVTSDDSPETARSALIRITLSEVAYGKAVKESAEVTVQRHGR